MTRSPLARFLSLWLLLGCASFAWAAGEGRPLILVTQGVAQYDATVEAIRRALPEALILGTDGPEAAKKLPPAPVLVAVGEKAWELARNGSPDANIVFCLVLGAQRPDAAAHQVGVPLEPNPSMALASIEALLPGAKRIGLIYNPKISDVWAAEATRSVRAAGLTLVTKNVDSAAKVRAAADSLKGAVDVLWLPVDPRLFTKDVVTSLVEFSTASRVPLIGFLHTLTKVGAFASIAPDYGRIGTVAGQLAQQVMRGEHPAPITFAPGDLTVNQSVAKQLGLDVPPSALGAASYVYR